jgi:hypothetical protein
LVLVSLCAPPRHRTVELVTQVAAPDLQVVTTHLVQQLLHRALLDD